MLLAIGSFFFLPQHVLNRPSDCTLSSLHRRSKFRNERLEEPRVTVSDLGLILSLQERLAKADDLL